MLIYIVHYTVFVQYNEKKLPYRILSVNSLRRGEIEGRYHVKVSWATRRNHVPASITFIATDDAPIDHCWRQSKLVQFSAPKR